MRMFHFPEVFLTTNLFNKRKCYCSPSCIFCEVNHLWENLFFTLGDIMGKIINIKFQWWLRSWQNTVIWCRYLDTPKKYYRWRLDTSRVVWQLSKWFELGYLFVVYKTRQGAKPLITSKSKSYWDHFSFWEPGISGLGGLPFSVFCGVQLLSLYDSLLLYLGIWGLNRCLCAASVVQYRLRWWTFTFLHCSPQRHNSIPVQCVVLTTLTWTLILNSFAYPALKSF